MDALTINAEVVETRNWTDQIDASETPTFVQSSMLSELPGLAFALTTLIYVVASLVAM